MGAVADAAELGDKAVPMPLRSLLKVGEVIRLLRVPDLDLEQREREHRDGNEKPDWTADTLDRIIAMDPAVVIDRIDYYGTLRFSYELREPDGSVDYHYIAILEDDSREKT